MRNIIEYDCGCVMVRVDTTVLPHRWDYKAMCAVHEEYASGVE